MNNQNWYGARRRYLGSLWRSPGSAWGGQRFGYGHRPGVYSANYGYHGGHWPNYSASHFRQGRYWPSARFRRLSPGFGAGYSQSAGGPGAGASSPWIGWAQRCLAQAVGSWVPQSGTMGHGTRKAIRMFQSRQQLPVTGILDQTTIQALQAACAAPQANAPMMRAPMPPPPDGDDAAAASAAASSAAPPDAGADGAPPPDTGDAAPPADAPAGEFQVNKKKHKWHHKRGAHRWRRHFRRYSSYGQPPSPSAYPQDSDDDSQDDGDDDSQEFESTPSAGCNEDRCTSDYIAWVQQSLNQLGSRLKITEVLDRQTIQAINAFKQQHGISFREYYASPVLEQALIKAGASQPPRVRRLACGPSDVKTVLLPALNRYCGDIPVHYLLGWITVESGGKLGDLTKLCERGYFQVHPEESQDLHLVHDLLSTDPDRSVEGGIKLVRKYAAIIEQLAKQYGIPRGGDLYWGLVKLCHWIPSAPARILAQMKKDQAPITTWNSIERYVDSKAQLGFGGFDPHAGVASVHKFLAAATRWWSWLQKNASASQPANAGG